MRVILIHNRYRSAQPSGEDVVVDQEYDLLVSAGHHVVRFERRSDDISQFSALAKASVPVRQIWSVSDRRDLAIALAGERFDVAHVHNTFPLISPSVLSACRDAGVPVVATLHNFRTLCAAGTLLRDGRHCTDCVGRLPLPAVRHRCYRGSVAATAPLAASIAVHDRRRTWQRGVDVFVVMSDFAKAVFVRAGWDERQFAVKPHFVSALGEPRTGPGSYAMYLGRLSQEKGPDLLVDAWRREFGRLLIVGDGPDRVALEDRARGLGDAVSFVGAVPRDEAMQMLREARMVINSSRAFETFGLSAVEAFAHGVPAVVPDHGVFTEVVTDGEDGVRFAPGDVDSLRGAIRTLLDENTSIAFGRRALARHAAHYSAERNLRLLETIYDRAITAAGTGP